MAGAGPDVSMECLEGRPPQPTPAAARDADAPLSRAGTGGQYTYLWDDAQADATLADAAGSTRTLAVRDDGRR